MRQQGKIRTVNFFLCSFLPPPLPWHLLLNVVLKWVLAFFYNQFNIQVLQCFSWNHCRSLYLFQNNCFIWNFCFKVRGMCWLFQHAVKAYSINISNFSQIWGDSTSSKVETKKKWQKPDDYKLKLMVFSYSEWHRNNFIKKECCPNLNLRLSANHSTGGIRTKFEKGQLIQSYLAIVVFC